jgi:hypothetical protein
VRLPKTCSVEGCQRKHAARGWCRVHYARVKRTGDPGPVELCPVGYWARRSPSALSTSYGAVHRRVRKLNGHPLNYTCVCCNTRRAEHWAYDHGDPEPLIHVRRDNGRTVEYSADLSRYVAMCWVCHALFDRGLIVINGRSASIPRESARIG